MAFAGSGRASEPKTTAGGALYRALAVGDLGAAWLLTKGWLERGKTEKLPYTAAFNCGVCLYRLGEYEKALAQLKQAEQALGSPPDFDISERKPLEAALALAGEGTALLPLGPESGEKLERYGFLRVKWLTALCLLRLGRPQEAAPGIRFLRQYRIELS